jgi:tRNA/tmRNA/rRNA uracil-C5-methylase (TrmA/RlmC/RlmD family)
VDPPRAGLAPEVRAWLLAAAPRRLVYVSCNPVTLARDLGGLTAGGFALDDLRLFDLTPQASHVESVARLTFTGAGA